MKYALESSALVNLAIVAGLAASPAAHAERTQATLGIRLVIEPACPGGAPRQVAGRADALARAGAVLGVSDPAALRIDHDRGDTGKWRVWSADPASGVLVDKCSGEVAPPPKPG